MTMNQYYLATFLLLLGQRRNSVHAACKSHFEFELLTDDKGAETSFCLVDATNNVVLVSKEAGTYSSNTRYSESICLPPDGIFTFTIKDVDGLCCESGLGDFAIFFNGELIGAGGEFVDAQSFTFDTFGAGANSEAAVALERDLQMSMVPAAATGTKSSKATKGLSTATTTKAPKATKGPKAAKLPKLRKAKR